MGKTSQMIPRGRFPIYIYISFCGPEACKRGPFRLTASSALGHKPLLFLQHMGLLGRQ